MLSSFMLAIKKHTNESYPIYKLEYTTARKTNWD